MNVGMIILLIIILLLLGVIAIVFTKTYTLNEKLKKLKNTNQKVKSLSVIQEFMKVLGENLTSSSEKINKINEIPNIKEVKPMTHALDDFVFELREDVAEDSISIEDALSNCDQVDGREVEVPKVVGE